MLTLALILGTVHLTTDFQQSKAFNDFNPGIVLSSDAEFSGCHPTAGTYFNSDRRQSFLVGCTFSRPVAGTDLVLSVSAGALSGYRRGGHAAVIPFALPAVTYKGVRMSWVPPASTVGGAAVQGLNFALEFKL